MSILFHQANARFVATTPPLALKSNDASTLLLQYDVRLGTPTSA